MKGELTHYLLFVLVGDAILGRYAPDETRRAAWTDGFRQAFGGSAHRPLSLMSEHSHGYEAGLEVRWRLYPDGEMPERDERPEDTAVLLEAFEDEDGVIWI